MLELLLKERFDLMKERKELLEGIEKVTPPEGCRWTDERKNNELLILSNRHSILIDKLDQNKELIRLERMG